MWDPQWPGLTAARDAVRVDLRGFGESADRPSAALSHVDDLLETLDRLGVTRCHLVGASLGAGVAVEAALTRPEAVASLLLCPPGGSLLAELTPDLKSFIDAERAALEAGDLDAAVRANLTWWVLGPGRTAADVDPDELDRVGTMQRRAFEIDASWGEDVAAAELEPAALDRLAEIRAPALVLVGGHDLESVRRAATRLCDGIRGARRVDWPDVAHLPSLERPEEFLSLLLDWTAAPADPD
jgi:pimeloyl-ACP methyl ester carboxylesterase